MDWNDWQQAQAATADEFATAGRAARAHLPRSGQAEYTPFPGRDPLGIIAEQNATRIQELVPLRMSRMAASPFAFFRGTAGIQAADLSHGPFTGHFVVACGDAHMSNFGIFAGPDRTMLFDLNDFDEAAPAPWEWDVKRLATSAVLAARENGLTADDEIEAAEAAASSYREAIRAFAEQGGVDRFYARRVVTGDQVKGTSGKAVRRTLRRAERRTSETVAQKLLVQTPKGLRFREDPPVLTRLDGAPAERLEEAFADYRASASPDIRLLLLQYRGLDVARRVVGVGSVGTACFIAAFLGPRGEPLILQTKEAGRSVLMTYGRVGEQLRLPETLAAQLPTGGQRVVASQRMLQASSDPFLGYVSLDGRDFYVRQFRDRNSGFDISRMDRFALVDYARSCGQNLARGHVQSPGTSYIAAYLGQGRSFDRAIAQWSVAYAAQSEADYRAFVAALADGAFGEAAGAGGAPASSSLAT